MAFQTVDQWQVERHFMPSFDVAWLPALPSNLPHRNQLQKLSSGGFAILLHGTFFYFLLSGLLGQDIDDPTPQSNTTASSITMIEMGDAIEKETDESASGGSAATQMAATVPSKLETSVETEFSPEWLRSRIAVPRVVSNSGDIEIANATGAGSGIASGGNKGGAVYDPFAGAAPNRKPGLEERQQASEAPTLARRISGFFGFGQEREDEDAFALWVEELKARLPRAKGSVELSVTLGKDGTVKAGKVIGGSASPQVKFFVRNAVIGKKFSELARDEKNGNIRLPSIRLG